MLRTALILTAAASSVLFGQATLHLPISGFVFDAAAQSLRPVLGVPGSAYMGSAVAESLSAAWPSPNREAALARRGDETVLLRHLNTLQAVELPTALLPEAAIVAWDANGRIAAIYSSTTNSLQRVRLTETSAEIDSPETLPEIGLVQAVAVNSTGDIALASAEGIYLSAATGGLVPLEPVSATSITFGPDSVLYAAASGSLLEVQTRGAGPRPLVRGRDIVAVHYSAKDKRIWAIDAVNLRAFAFHQNGESLFEIPLERTPSALTPLNQNGVLLLNPADAQARPVLVLNTASANPAVFFVPSSL